MCFLSYKKNVSDRIEARLHVTHSAVGIRFGVRCSRSGARRGLCSLPETRSLRPCTALMHQMQWWAAITTRASRAMQNESLTAPSPPRPAQNWANAPYPLGFDG